MNHTICVPSRDNTMKVIVQCHPNHLPRPGIPESLKWSVIYGVLLAYHDNGAWYPSGSDQPITDQLTLALIAGIPEFDSTYCEKNHG